MHIHRGFKRRLPLLILVASLLALLGAVLVGAQDEAPAAEIANDEGGAVSIVGEVNSSIGVIEDFGPGAATVALLDVNAIIDRDFESDDVQAVVDQVLGYITSDPTQSPFTYEVLLPVRPPADLRDVDQDGDEDEGVVVMQVAVFTNFQDTSYWEQYVEYGLGLTSTRNSTAFEQRFDIVGGKLVIWSPDDEQGFPSGYGDDGVLFTEDDPIVIVPAGYIVVDLDTEPFTFDRAEQPTVDLYEQEQSLIPADYSEMSYTEAFDALIAQMREEYAFTDYKEVDFDALYEEYMPRFEEAEDNADPLAYQLALLEFSWEIPDGHVGANTPLTTDLFFAETDGGVGMAIRELDDGRIIVNYLTEGGPAEEAGIQLRAEILALNGQPVTAAMENVRNWAGPFSTPHDERYQQLRYVLRFPVDTAVEVTYKNPDADETSVTLTAIAERDSFTFSSANRGASPAGSPPVEFQILPSGYGYLQINTFSDSPDVIMTMMEWVIKYLNNNGVPGLIIDMRWNGGGYNLDLIMASYFFDEEVLVGTNAQYFPDLGEHAVDPFSEDRIYPSEEGLYYGGQVAVLVSQVCYSACEYFSYNLSLSDNVTVVGMYPSGGLGGSITPVFMPDDVYFQFTLDRALNADGDIRIEGIGVVPDVFVPVTEETLFYEGDVILDTAIGVLDEALSAEIVDGGAIAVGETVSGTLTPGVRTQYTWTVEADGVYNIIVSDEGDAGALDTYLRVYLDGELAAENDDLVPGSVITSGLEEVEIPAGLTLVIEVAGYEDAVEGDFTLTISLAGAEEAAPEATEEATAEATPGS